jgi:hypothetical protein
MYNFASEFDIIRDPGIDDEHEDRGKWGKRTTA